MTDTKEKRKKNKQVAREFYILEAEAGWDIKRYYHSFHKSEAEAKALAKYLELKNPFDKYEIIHCREILKLCK